MTGNVIGVFILGVFAGWLAEWLFVTFVMAKPQAASAPTTADKDDSEKKPDHASAVSSNNPSTMEKEIAAQSQPNVAKEQSVDDDGVSTSSSTVEKETTAQSKSGVEKEKITDSNASEPTKAVEKDTDTSTNVSAKTSDDSVSESNSKATTTVVKEEQQTLALDSENDAQVKAETEKVQAKVAAEESEKAEEKTAKTTEPEQQDDFMRLKGIGPKLAESIKKTKISRYDELSAFTGEELIAKLEASGAVIVNRPAFNHIPKQAALAAKGDWEALEALKKSI